MGIRHQASKALLSAVTLAALSAVPVQAHHSFAMYDSGTVKRFTGVVTRVDPAPNHLQIYFAPMNEERNNVERDDNGDPVLWNVEMSGSASMARQGVSVNTFPPGTVFSIGMNPLRNGDKGGTRVGGIFKCPERTPPEPGQHCDSVEGHTQIGSDGLGEGGHGGSD